MCGNLDGWSNRYWGCWSSELGFVLLLKADK
ncbi:hypothetical protein EVA_11463, partial [gut metagenome]